MNTEPIKKEKEDETHESKTLDLSLDDYELASLKLLSSTYINSSEIKKIKDKITFKDKLYENIGLDNIVKYSENMKEKIKTLSESKAYINQIVDIYSTLFFNIFDVKRNVKKEIKSGWNYFVKKLIEEGYFDNINKVTRGNAELSEIGTIQFFVRLSNTLRKMYNININDLQRKNDKEIEEMFNNKDFESEVEYIISQLKGELEESKELKDELKETVEEVKNMISKCKCKSKNGNGNLTNQLIQLITGGQNYGSFSLEYLTFYSNKSELRRRLSRFKLITQLYKLFKGKIESKKEGFGVQTDFGKFKNVEKIRNISEIRNVLPSQFALPYALVVERIVTLRMLKYKFEKKPKFRIYIDKSGSMAGGFGYIQGASVSKIDVATSLAFAIWSKFDTEVLLFDTTVYELKPNEILKALLEVKADYGTDIQRVLEDLENRDKGEYNIIISDGISYVEENYAQKIASKCNVILILIPPAGKYNWINYFRKYYCKNVNDMLEVVAQL